jgi:cell division protein FtsL
MAVAAPRQRAVAAPAAARSRPRRSERGPGARPRRAAPARPRLARGVAWIAIVGALLAGIVALNVAVLQLRMERGKIHAEIVTLEEENADLESQISSAASVSKVEGAARRLGLVEPSQTTYVEVERP